MTNYEGLRLLTGLLLLLQLSSTCVQAHLIWDWNYTNADGTIAASGTLQTEDSSDAEGFYNITSMEGTRNGVAIADLTEVGVAIPGNEPYVVDNAIREGSTEQLRSAGIGLLLEDGNYLNPYYASWETSYIEVYSVEPHVVNYSNFGPEDGYNKVNFTAVIVGTEDGPGSTDEETPSEDVGVDDGSSSGSVVPGRVSPWIVGAAVMGLLSTLL